MISTKINTQGYNGGGYIRYIYRTLEHNKLCSIKAENYVFNNINIKAEYLVVIIPLFCPT